MESRNWSDRLPITSPRTTRKRARKFGGSGYEGFSLVARPVYGQGLVFVAGTADQGHRHVFYAIRPDGRGEVTQTKMAWSLTRAVPPCPVASTDRERALPGQRPRHCHVPRCYERP